MKHSAKTLITLALAAMMLVSCAAPEKPQEGATVTQTEKADQAAPQEDEKTGLWKDAIYVEDTEFGSGKVEVRVEVKAEGRSVTFTLKTDCDTVGAALLEHSLISGEQGEFGLYVKVVNGITADFDVDQSYWAFTKDGEMMPVAVDAAQIEDGAHYELVYTK